MNIEMIRKEVSEKPTTGDNSFGIVGVVFGILSILSLSIGGVIMGIIGLIFSLKQKKVAANKWSKAGIILNIIGIIVGVIAIYFLVNYATSYISQLQGLQGVQ